MNTRRCLKIADRMHTLLMRELGEGADGLRMVTEPLYARDVLLVCDAMPGTELASLAQHFRVAANERQDAQAPAAPPPGARSSGFASGSGGHAGPLPSTGFGPSGPGPGSSLDPVAEAGQRAASQPPPRRWYSPARWLAGK